MLKLTEQEVRSLYEDRKMTIKAISILAGIGWKALSRHMDKWEIKKRSRSESSTIMWRGLSSMPPKEELELLYLTKKLSTCEIARDSKVCQKTVLAWLKGYGIPARNTSESNKLRNLSGKNNPSWKGGKCNSGGYIYIRLLGHHRTSKQGYVREHILVWERANKKLLPDNYVIHHKNGIPSDNRPENLEAMTQSEHTKLHRIALREMQGLFSRVSELSTTVSQLSTIITKIQIESSLLSQSLYLAFEKLNVEDREELVTIFPTLPELKVRRKKIEGTMA